MERIQFKKRERPNIQITVGPDGEEKEQEIGNLFEKI